MGVKSECEAEAEAEAEAGPSGSAAVRSPVAGAAASPPAELPGWQRRSSILETLRCQELERGAASLGAGLAGPAAAAPPPPTAAYTRFRRFFRKLKHALSCSPDGARVRL